MSITSMRMLDNSSAEIRWRLTGKLGMLPVDVAGEQRCWCIVHLMAHKLRVLPVDVAGAQRCWCIVHLMAHKLRVLPVHVAGAQRCFCWAPVLWRLSHEVVEQLVCCSAMHVSQPEQWMHALNCRACNCAHLAAGATEIVLNLLTGRIEKQKETWDLSKCSPPAAAAWNAARALWAAKQVGRQPG